MADSTELRLFSRILIANRGEIAVRIARTCREMGVATVAVYSDADRDALHVRAADEAYLIGPPPALESYLDIDAVLDAARRSGADAIHPGYGFLAENAGFAQAVIDAGIVWVGPPPEVIRQMGDKVAAKDLARSVGVPVVPGYDGAEQSAERLAKEAERIGYPVLLKAAAGGGGKGMRTVTSPDELAGALDSAKREAHSAFGDGRVFLEKLLVRPRHIEMQLFADTHGNAIYLGERDCSIQRRHQKVIEEAPSPVMTPELRAAMGDAAVKLARAAGYVNAGTIEFLFESDRFYFLEMNTRIQVEHPVTEEVTGLDLIRLQLEIAAGNVLPLAQGEVPSRGHSIEARIYAEDPRHGFFPMTGQIGQFAPPEGPGVRNDVGVESGTRVPPYYDPMLAKLVVSGANREEAVARLQGSLGEYVVSGLTTNLDFLRWVADHPEFQEGRADITFIDRNWDPEAVEPLPDEALMLLGAWLAVRRPGPVGGPARGHGPYGDGIRRGDPPVVARPRTSNSEPRTANSDDPNSPWSLASGWGHRGMSRTYRLLYGLELSVVRVARGEGGKLQVEIGERREQVQVFAGPELAIKVGDRVVRGVVESVPDGWAVGYEGRSYLLTAPNAPGATSGRRGAQKSGAGHEGAVSPMPGTVVKVMVAEGQRVRAREPLVVLEAMKMEHVVESPHDGVVKAVLFAPGDLVPAGASVVEFSDQ